MGVYQSYDWGLNLSLRKDEDNMINQKELLKLVKKNSRQLLWGKKSDKYLISNGYMLVELPIKKIDPRITSFLFGVFWKEPVEGKMLKKLGEEVVEDSVQMFDKALNYDNAYSAQNTSLIKNCGDRMADIYTTIEGEQFYTFIDVKYSKIVEHREAQNIASEGELKSLHFSNRDERALICPIRLNEGDKYYLA